MQSAPALRTKNHHTWKNRPPSAAVHATTIPTAADYIKQPAMPPCTRKLHRYTFQATRAPRAEAAETAGAQQIEQRNRAYLD